jgi:hypothetical protein
MEHPDSDGPDNGSDTEDPVLLGPRELIASFDAALRAGVVRHLVRHLPAGVSPTEVRQSFVDRVGGRPAACWQDVWDEWVDTGRGQVQLTLWRCGTCRGRRFDMRTGKVCATCSGRGSFRHQVSVPANHAPRPD